MRYYMVMIGKNLFGEYIVTKSFGSVASKTPTRTINEFHPTLEQSVVEVKRTIAKKEKKGYEPFLTRNRGLNLKITFKSK